MNGQKKVDYLDVVKGIAIFMIMFGHVTELANPVDTWMSSCKITIFYVISGFLMAHTQALKKRTSGQFIKNIANKIAWPYLTFSVLAVIVKTFFVFSKHSGTAATMEALKDNIAASIFLKGINSMWFLPTLFFGELIILALYLLPKTCRVIYAFIGLLGLNAASVAICYFEESGVSAEVLELFGHTINMLGKSFVAAWFIGCGYCTYLLMSKLGWKEGHFTEKLLIGSLFTVSNIYFSLQNAHVDFNQMKYGEKPYLFIYGGVIGSWGLILLLDALSQKVNMGWIGYWGRNTLVIMCVHTALGFRKIAVTGWAQTAYIPGTSSIEYIIECLMALVILSMLMYTYIEMTNRYFPYMIKRPTSIKVQ